MIPDQTILVNALRNLVAARGRSGEPSSVDGLRFLGRASDLAPGAVGAGDDVTVWLTPEGMIVVSGMKDGPTAFINETTAFANVTTQYTFSVAAVARYGLQIEWTGNGGTTRILTFNTYGKIDTAAWPAAGTIPAWRLINGWWQITPISTGWGVAAVTGGIVARLADPGPFQEIAVEMTTALTDVNTTTVLALRVAYGGAR